MDFEIFAYPYPGRSAKISAGLTFIFSPAPSCSEKKLIARVRPGVEETFASREPSSELISEDFPTFDRPRNATSGAPYVFASEGKCATSVADNKKTGFSRMNPVYRQQRDSPRGLGIPAVGKTRNTCFEPGSRCF